MALYLVIQVSAILSRLLPRSWRYFIGTVVGEGVLVVWRAKATVLRQNMAQVTGLPVGDPLVRRLAKRSMRNHCKYLIEFLELPSISPEDPVVAGMQLSGIEHLQEAIQQGNGVILASGHFGSLELPALRLRDFTSFHAVYDTFKPPYLDRLIQTKRLEKGIDLVPTSNVRKMLKVLSGGGTLAILFDRPVSAAKGTCVNFFGRETYVPAGPAVLAMKTGAAIVPVYVTRHSDNTFHAMLSPALLWTRTGDRERDAQHIMQQLVYTLECAVRSRPDQWYMFRPMWPREAVDAVAKRSVSKLPQAGA